MDDRCHSQVRCRRARRQCRVGCEWNVLVIDLNVQSDAFQAGAAGHRIVHPRVGERCDDLVQRYHVRQAPDHGVELDKEVLHVRIGALAQGRLEHAISIRVNAEDDVADAVTIEVDARKTVFGTAGTRGIGGPDRAILPAIKEAISVRVRGVRGILDRLPSGIKDKRLV